MTLQLKYPDIATFVKVAPNGYANNKEAIEQIDVPVIFIQNTGFERSSSQDSVVSDAICYPDFTNQFISDYANRLEGMYILAPLFGVDDPNGWFKITDVTINRDHLLNNIIDNIELKLKKTRPIPGVIRDLS